MRPLGPTPVRGLDQPIEVYELIGAGTARTRFQASAARGLTPFVGRQDERAAIDRALTRAQAGHGQVVALVAEAGVGKSRLVWEVDPLRPPQRLDGAPDRRRLVRADDRLAAGDRSARKLLPDREP